MSGCIFGLMILGTCLGISDPGQPSNTLDASCDLRVTQAPADLKHRWLDERGRPRRALSPQERQYVLDQAGNNRILKKRCGGSHD
ncbi:hypothetical protein [Breoghania sp. L-A4]|uniref:hypothetical protein n=1 Tax=Breoghania sp. L-A4 TaxID=2304600 RepID=UPI000E35F68A|nr:hypothetical protein [Breoghania sp. L-A4]AXS39287.1 hypothetical protein D1F64_03475 [Breoghania sp. L-A4]